MTLISFGYQLSRLNVSKYVLIASDPNIELLYKIDE